MFFQLKNRIQRMHFSINCSNIITTSPVLLHSESDVAVVSQLQHKDVLLYLLAVKSFLRQVKARNVYIIDDGSLLTKDIDLLNRHIPGGVILKSMDFNSPYCPRGGCWERLLFISELVKNHYVIQLDSDTLTLDSISEVNECVKKKIAFIIGTWDDQSFESMCERQDTASRLLMKQGTRAHVQLVAEANFNKLTRFKLLKYIRGCSGFTGFPRNSFSRNFVEDISREMQKAIGEKWNAWGSEQVMSNIIAANIPDTVVLPHPKYCSCRKIDRLRSVFVHFVGTCRFNNGLYARMGKDVISQLKFSSFGERNN